MTAFFPHNWQFELPMEPALFPMYLKPRIPTIKFEPNGRAGH